MKVYLDGERERLVLSAVVAGCLVSQHTQQTIYAVCSCMLKGQSYFFLHKVFRSFWVYRFEQRVTPRNSYLALSDTPSYLLVSQVTWFIGSDIWEPGKEPSLKISRNWYVFRLNTSHPSQSSFCSYFLLVRIMIISFIWTRTFKSLFTNNYVAHFE